MNYEKDIMNYDYLIKAYKEILTHIHENKEKIILTPRKDDIELIQSTLNSMKEAKRQEQLHYFLKHKGLQCPFCHSTQHTTSNPTTSDGDPTLVIITAQCDECKKEWEEFYTLSDVQEISPI